MYKILQAPYDGSSKVPGCRLGPSKIVDYAIESGYGLEHSMVEFCTIVNQSERISFCNIAHSFKKLYCVNKSKILTIGGNHIITYPILNTLGETEKNFSLIYFDAHSDTENSIIPTNASFISYFARENPAVQISNVGLRFKEHTLSPNVFAIASSAFYIQSIDSIVKELVVRHQNHPVYVSIDLDVLDPCYAPGVSSPIGGGISTAQINEVLKGILQSLDVVSIDLTEYNPFKDKGNITLSSTLSILWEIHKVWR